MRRVSDILVAAGLRGEWPSRLSEDDRAWLLQRGTFVHKATELFDLGQLDWVTLDERIRPYALAWRKFRQEVGGDILAIEQAVSNKRLGYIGHLDRRLGPCGVCKHPTVVDLKTNQWDTATRLQLSAYRMCLKNKAHYRRMAVSLFDTGNYKCEVFDRDEEDDVAWMACVQLATWTARNGVDK